MKRPKRPLKNRFEIIFPNPPSPRIAMGLRGEVDGRAIKEKVFSVFLLVFIFFVSFPHPSAFSQINSEILVFAGAGMRIPLIEIGKRFEEEKGITVLFDFAGSGRLGNKILMGQHPDLFIPGSDKWANILIEKGLIEDYLPIAHHIPVIITPEKNHKINGLKDFMLPDNQIVLGDPKAAALGKISSAIFKKAGMDEAKMNIRARGVTVKQLVLWIEGNNADAAIVWHADAVQSGKVRWIDIPDIYNVTNMIPVCRMGNKKETASHGGSQLTDYLFSHEGKKIFEKHGFVVMD